jgi:hypothetical protein
MSDAAARRKSTSTVGKKRKRAEAAAEDADIPRMTLDGLQFVSVAAPSAASGYAAMYLKPVPGSPDSLLAVGPGPGPLDEEVVAEALAGTGPCDVVARGVIAGGEDAAAAAAGPSSSSSAAAASSSSAAGGGAGKGKKAQRAATAGLPYVIVRLANAAAVSKALRLGCAFPPSDDEGRPTGLRGWLAAFQEYQRVDQRALQSAVDAYMAAFDEKEKEVRFASEGWLAGRLEA